MMGWADGFDPDMGIKEAMERLEAEQAKVGKLSELWRDGRTVIRAKDHSLSMTFDGRGDPVELVFNASKYRSMPPAQLAKVVLDTLRQGRVESVQKMSEIMGAGSATGLDFGEIVNGNADPQELMERLISPFMENAREVMPGLGGPKSKDE